MKANRITTITCLPGSFDPLTGTRIFAIRQHFGLHYLELEIPAPTGRAAVVAFRAAFAQVGPQDCLREVAA